MTNREQAKMTMYAGTDTFLTDNVAVYTGNVAFETEKAKFDAAYVLVKKVAAKTGTDNSGFSEEKNLAKTEMAKQAAKLSGFAKVRFEDLGELDLAGQLHIGDSDYTHLSDSQSVTRAQATHDLLNANLAMLTPDYVTAANITALDTVIGDFESAQGSSDAVHQTEPEDTSAFKDSLPVIDKSLGNLKLLGRFYEDTASEFYNELLLVTQIPPVNVHHTNVNVKVTATEDGHPIANATGALSNSDKTGESDLNGVLHIEEVRSGDAVLTVSATGRKTLQQQIDIERGTDNNFNVGLEAA
jgi:hypothetical protein